MSELFSTISASLKSIDLLSSTVKGGTLIDSFVDDGKLTFAILLKGKLIHAAINDANPTTWRNVLEECPFSTIVDMKVKSEGFNDTIVLTLLLQNGVHYGINFVLEGRMGASYHLAYHDIPYKDENDFKGWEAILKEILPNGSFGGVSPALSAHGKFRIEGKVSHYQLTYGTHKEYFILPVVWDDNGVEKKETIFFATLPYLPFGPVTW